MVTITGTYFIHLQIAFRHDEQRCRDIMTAFANAQGEPAATLRAAVTPHLRGHPHLIEELHWAFNDNLTQHTRYKKHVLYVVMLMYNCSII